MDTLINLGASFVSAHPKVAGWLLFVMAIDQFLKTIKGALKLNIPDNVFDGIGEFCGGILSKIKGPNA